MGKSGNHFARIEKEIKDLKGTVRNITNTPKPSTSTSHQTDMKSSTSKAGKVSSFLDFFLPVNLWISFSVIAPQRISDKFFGACQRIL